LGVLTLNFKTIDLEQLRGVGGHRNRFGYLLLNSPEEN